jgi:hypothetical protein
MAFGERQTLAEIEAEGFSATPPCDSDDNRANGTNADCTTGTSAVYNYCYAKKCYSKSNYRKIQVLVSRQGEEIVETTMTSEATLAIEAAAAAAAAAEQAAVDEASAINKIFYKSKKTYIDEDGFLIEPVFHEDYAELVSNSISTGEVGVLSTTFTESLYGNEVVLFYTVSDSDNPTLKTIKDTSDE